MRIFIYRLTVILLMLACFTSANSADVFHEDIKLARDIYLRATDGDKRNIRKAIQHMNKLAAKYSDQPLAQAFKGGALSLRGLDVSERPLNRLRNTEEGLDYIDRALRQIDRVHYNTSDAIETKLIAAYVFVNIPDTIFHRLQEGSSLIEDLLANPNFLDLPREMRAAVYFAAATAAEKLQKQEDFKHYLTLTVDTDPRGINGKAAREKLDQLANQ